MSNKPRDLPEPPSPAFVSQRQSLHIDANPFSNPGSPTRSPERQGAYGSPYGTPRAESPTRFGSPTRYGSAHGARGTPRAEWTRRETPVSEFDPIVIDDDDDAVLAPPPVFPTVDSLRQSQMSVTSDLRQSVMSTSSGGHSSHGYGHQYALARSITSQSTSSSITATSSRDSMIDHDEDDDDEMEFRKGDEKNGYRMKYLDDRVHDEEEYDEEDDSDAHSVATVASHLYEAPLQAQPRRHKSMARKKVKLVRGNLVLDCPVPTKLYSFLPRRDNDEFVYMRYTACTATPDEFNDEGFTLRPAVYERETQLCICITMYNEDEVAFTRTMHAVMKNIAHLCSRNKSRVWGKEGWKKVVVTIVSDGRTKIHPRVLDCLAAMGVYQDGIAKQTVNGKEVQAHLYEYTTQVSLDSDLKFQGAERGIMPVQLLFCLKEKNAKKINSHRWLFNAFCPQLQPNVCILLDVGTKPGKDSLYHLWKAFDADSNIGGACGEITAMKGKQWRALLNPLVASQNFEYKMSNILDKPLESVFGYISVLPGALSAYRYRALCNNPDGTGPLNSYFKGESLHGRDADVFTSNMYLAEDRILCWELVAKLNEKWMLKYVPSATGETDVPDSVPEFVSQRRRWLNGALFAAIYSLTHFTQIWKTDHSVWRKCLLHVEFAYQFLQLLFTFFSLGNFFLAFYYVAGSISGPDSAVISNNGGLVLFVIFKYLCITTIVAQFVISLGNRPQGSHYLFLGSMVIFALITAYSTGVGLYFVIKTLTLEDTVSLGNNVFTNIFVSLASTYGLYAVMSFLYLDPWHILTCSVQYILLLPSSICTLQVYSFCNTHDVTWGTKGDNELTPDLGSAVAQKDFGQDVVEIEMPSEQLDIDSGYEEALGNLRENKVIESAPPSMSTVTDDYYRDIRSRVVLVWMALNMVLVVVVTEVYAPSETASNDYLKFILWSVAALALFRAIGSLAFLFIRILKYLNEAKARTLKRHQGLTGQQ